MITVADYAARVQELIPTATAQSMSLSDAAGYALAADVVAPRSLPAFDNSSMDGYAVRAEDLHGADESPVFLRVKGDIYAGRTDVVRLAAGSAYRIMTGALVPDGADTVIPVEETDNSDTFVGISTSRAAGSFIRRAGEDVRAGETVLHACDVLGPAQLGLLAGLGLTEVTVLAPVKILVLSTGSELISPDENALAGKIYDSNAIMLASACQDAGATVVHAQFVADDIETFLQTINHYAPHVDVILTSGGISAGNYEVVKDALRTHEAEFIKVAMQPGMPQGYGRVFGTPIVALPGNPVSALVSFEVFVRPALRNAMRLRPTRRRVVCATLTHAVSSPMGKRQFRRGRLTSTDAGMSVEAVGPPASHFLRWLAQANCLIDIPATIEQLPAGSDVQVWMLD